MLEGTRLILASASPRRLEILSRHGITPEVYSPDIDEALPPGLTLAELPAALMSLAEQKAREVLGRLRETGRLGVHEPALILAADTVVFADGVLGKPADRGQAVAILTALSGRSHQVLTAVAVISWPADSVTSFTDQAEVRFKNYGLPEIEAYIQSEPPYDKAGAYAIQGSWQSQVASLTGDIETVIGLPFTRLAEHLGL